MELFKQRIFMEMVAIKIWKMCETKFILLMEKLLKDVELIDRWRLVIWENSYNDNLSNLANSKIRKHR